MKKVVASSSKPDEAQSSQAGSSTGSVTVGPSFVAASISQSIKATLAPLINTNVKHQASVNSKLEALHNSNITLIKTLASELTKLEHQINQTFQTVLDQQDEMKKELKALNNQ
ncbi:hypothetical protein K1719_016033 [Acacia pycnantha]|nr:hypothetical protein K1719_016033 [Acacia pycnantha]